MTFTTHELKATLHEHTTFCNDIINIIAEKVQANLPRHFKLGEKYKASRHDMLTIDRITKCFVVFSITRNDRTIDCRVYAKIRKDQMGHQCIKHKYLYQQLVAYEP